MHGHTDLRKEIKYLRRISTGISHLSMEIRRKKIRKLDKEKELQNKKKHYD
jgi:hypothetical protein